MSEASQKRRQPAQGGPAYKKSKGGNAGKWKTSYQATKSAQKFEMGTSLAVDDQGIWVTFARGMRPKAMKEFKELCEKYGEELYNIKPPAEDDDSKDDGDEQDIEASIQQELSAIKSAQRPKSRQVFTPISAGIECLFFMKTMKPVDPVQLIRKICEDARDCPDPMQRKCKYINRLTPVSDTDRATEKGMVRVARTVLAPHFDLVEEIEEGKEEGKEEDTDKGTEEGAEGKPKTVTDAEDSPGYTYAIRYNIRNHTAFKSNFVIQKIAGLVGPRHKVNLSNPDKVILVEIFQLFCGVSVVEGKEWEKFKRYNMNELYAAVKHDDNKDGQPKSEKEADAA